MVLLGYNFLKIKLGVEVIKNIVMMGSKSVTLFDPNIVTMNDVGRNFYCN